jgi:hypothetical protein
MALAAHKRFAPMGALHRASAFGVVGFTLPTGFMILIPAGHAPIAHALRVPNKLFAMYSRDRAPPCQSTRHRRKRQVPRQHFRRSPRVATRNRRHSHAAVQNEAPAWQRRQGRATHQHAAIGSRGELQTIQTNLRGSRGEA